MKNRLLGYRSISLRVFVMLLIGYIIIHIYKLKNPLILPGIETRFMFTLAVVGMVTVLLYLPYEKISAIKDKVGEEPKGVSEKFKEELQTEYFKKSIEIVFSSLLTLYLLLLLIQQILPDAFKPVPIMTNLNYLLLAVIVFGVIHILLHKEEHGEKKAEKLTGSDYVLIIALSVAGGAIIWYKTQNIGRLSYLISIIGGALILLLSIMVLEEDYCETDKTS